MKLPAKKAIILAFGEADNYHRDAHVQRRVAQELARMLAKQPFSAQPHILEIGCGSGFLSQHLLQGWPAAHFLLSDISWPMVQRCRANLGEASANVHYAVLDGEQPALAPAQTPTHVPALAPGFELITASMVFQWFANPIHSLAGLSRLLHPGGCLAFATLGKQTFQEWQAACTDLGVASGLSNYPSSAAWKQGWQPQGTACMWEERITVNHPSSLAFLHALKTIGANLPHPDYHVQPAGVLRRLLRHLDQESKGFAITYHVLYGIFTKKGGSTQKHSLKSCYNE